ncbi:phosphoglycolate phosphatase [Dickeya dadantii]|uniref:phosphoglycolate phosphatase n=1 Tax=Dickeya dadantii TaxID=204038 RepID=UPI001495A89A|nr:phosphoglycolate phosphatase [Dickeya dadantii]NPE58593.1 phosphoglycolate phosphatase [Dickeya dadantii]
MADFAAIRGLAFDLDGTLINSAPGLAEAVDMTLGALSLPRAGEERVSTWIGNGADVLVERALLWAGMEPTARQVQDARSLFDKYYARTVDSGSQLFSGVQETLAQLAERGFRMAVVTNKPTPFVAPLLEMLGIGDDFALIIGGDDVTEKKPHPAPLYMVLGKLGLHANELLFVGDSRNDIQAARAAGCPCVGMTYGYNYGEAIALSHPDVVLDRFADLLTLAGLPLSNDQEA